MSQDQGALLFELGTEEIPARFLPRAERELGERVVAGLDALELAHGPVRTYATPRRLAVAIDVAARQADRSEVVMGPPARVAFDGAGQPTKAAEGFAARNGLSLDQLERQQTPKGEYLVATVHTPGQATAALAPAVLTEAVTGLQWPKPMRFGTAGAVFIRPVHWVVALFDGDVLPHTLSGIPRGREPRGHRFSAPAPFAVDSETAWLAGLRAAHVEPDPRRRTETIASEARRLAASVGGALVEDADLLAHVAGLVEWPTPLLGTFDPAYLDIPAQVIVELMRVHQKYFAVRDAAGGLSNHFVCVAGTAVKDPAVVAAGNQRVLAARLSDGRFFWTSDQRRPLASYVDDLAQRTFLKGLGTMRDKALRLEVLARKLAEALYGGGGGDGAGGDAAARAGLLAKADLATGLVGEFPELQGEMGAEYARLGADPEPAAVATAIAEHYRPRFAGDALPATPAGAAVALADKLDSIVGCFCLGLEPTGSADPYALRRQALGVIHVLSALPQGGSPLGLGACLDLAREAYADVVAGDWPAVRARVLDFFRARLKALLADEFPTDLTEAVLEAGCDAPGAVRGRLTALSAVKRSAGWEDLAAAVKRVVRIVADQAPGALDPATLTEPAERALYEAFVGVERATVAALAAGRYDDALGRLVSLKPAIDGFFDAIMVMSDDPGERGRRLALLGGIAGLFRQVAAFDRVST